MSSDALAHDDEPAGGEYSIVCVAYALQATGAFGFLLGPLAGLVLSYIRRDAADAGYIATHHRWLIRTFWWTALAYLACLAVILAGAWPFISGILGEVIRSGGQADEFSFRVALTSLFATVGAAMAGGVGIVAVWIWNIYRLVRGALLLTNRCPAP